MSSPKNYPGEAERDKCNEILTEPGLIPALCMDDLKKIMMARKGAITI